MILNTECNIIKDRLTFPYTSLIGIFFNACTVCGPSNDRAIPEGTWLSSPPRLNWRNCLPEGMSMISLKCTIWSTKSREADWVHRHLKKRNVCPCADWMCFCNAGKRDLFYFIQGAFFFLECFWPKLFNTFWHLSYCAEWTLLTKVPVTFELWLKLFIQEYVCLKEKK